MFAACFVLMCRLLPHGHHYSTVYIRPRDAHRISTDSNMGTGARAPSALQHHNNIVLLTRWPQGVHTRRPGFVTS